MIEALGEWRSLAAAGGALLGAVLVGLLVQWIFWRLLSRAAGRSSMILDDSLVRHCHRPTILVFPVLAVYLVLPVVREGLGDDVVRSIENLLVVLLTVSVAWGLIRLTSVAEDLIVSRYDIALADNLRARAIQTQFGIVRKIAAVAIGVLALAVVLMNFEGFRELGTGLLASAGLVGLVVGLAAQKTLSNLLAGIQLAVTQPIRLDDVVIVEGEWGRIEEITLTYVVVRIWDRRRLIVPIGYFLETPFQNWTRVSAEILGSIYLQVDYTVPVEEIRAQLEQIVRASKDWDGEVFNVQVTDTSAQGIEVRALVSAADASKAWDLRCEVREKLVAFLQKNYPDCLPKVRTDLLRVPESLAKPG